MPVWQWLLDAAGALLLLVLCYGIALIVRRRVLSVPPLPTPSGPGSGGP